MDKIAVRISSNHLVFIEAGADSFGQIFANASDEEQIHILRSMVEHMKPHRQQWDYISIALEKPENLELRNELQDCLFPDIHAKDAEIAKLREALRSIAETRWDANAAEACLCTIQIDAHSALKESNS